MTNDAPAIQAAVNAIASGEIYFPSGTYAVAAEIRVPDNHTLIGEGPAASILLAIAPNINIIHHIGSNGGAVCIGLSGNNQAGVSGLRVTPLNESQTTTVVNQNFNRFRDLVITGCTEGVVLQAGPFVGGVNSGCWYNSFETSHVLSCTRAIWLKDGPNATSSGSNGNTFVGVRVGGVNSNTGLEIDSGDSNEFHCCAFEGVAAGAAPNATPTAILIKAAGLYSGNNDNNRFFGVRNEACTLDLNNADPYSEFYGCGFSTHSFAALPKIMMGGSAASEVPQIAEWMLFQQNGEVAGFPNTALNLRLGQVAFPATQNPSANANTLDDYMEGTWTPAISALGISGAAYSIQDGSYVKIGKHVFFWGHVKLSALTSGGTNYLSITGLPYASAGTDAAVSLNYDALTGGIAGQMPVARVVNGQTAVSLIEVNNNGIASGTRMSGARLTATSEFWVSGQYIASH